MTANLPMSSRPSPRTQPERRRATARRGAAALGLFLLALLAPACGGSQDEGQWVFGQILQMNVSNLQRVSSVSYMDEGVHYVVEPQGPDREFVMANIRLVNRRSGNISLLVDSDSVNLEAAGGVEFSPADPYVQRRTVDQAAVDESQFVPLLWGVLEIPKDFEVEGWVAFDVATGAEINRLIWRHVDVLSMFVDVK